MYVCMYVCVLYTLNVIVHLWMTHKGIIGSRTCLFQPERYTKCLITRNSNCSIAGCYSTFHL